VSLVGFVVSLLTLGPTRTSPKLALRRWFTLDDP
jgi:hypothetical protein